MSSYNSAQIADLFGIYLLDMLGRIMDLKQVRLYIDDILIFIPESNDPKTTKMHKKIIRAFDLLGLKIEITSHWKIVNFLDITLNLDDTHSNHLIRTTTYQCQFQLHQINNQTNAKCC